MRFASTPTARRRETLRTALAASARALVLLYWLASAAFGYLRLRDGGFSREAWGEMLQVWYLEALVFLAVFGGAALLMGVFSRQAREKRRRVAASDPLSNTTLAAIERHRAH